MTDRTDTSETLSDAAQAALRTWIREQGIGTELTDVEPLAGGTQNIVVRLRIDDRTLVLRRPPAHPRPTSDKTMLREIAVLRTLAGSTVPHPGFVAGCEDVDVLGVVFYLMEEIDGFNPGSEISHTYVDDAAARHLVGLSYAADVVKLGQVPWERSPLAAIRRPGSFLARQVPQWRSAVHLYRQQENYAHDSLPGVDELADWLESRRPPDSGPGIMHGDIHLNNTMLRRDRPEVAAFVDWEMCTIGDPLLDLGWMLICWPVGPDPLGAGEKLSALGGLASRPELLDAYLDAGGRETEHLDWYLALACLKLGVVIEGTWARYLAGLAPQDAGERLHAAAVDLIDLGGQVAAGRNPFGLPQ
ncbi:MAG: putative aminoglycoside phosphotransferase [Mycobacterium sp.]|jgi:aminoglycoside phosphotransferase (APT) family kinase protein|nr:putative aminoglycoside phosphotransferase [Mycobacterium sp.]